MEKRDILLLRIKDENGKIGLGEVAPLPGLSSESIQDCINLLQDLKSFDQIEDSYLDSSLPSSLRMGIEMALADLKSEEAGVYFPKGMDQLRSGIRINGLVWMGDKEFMKEQVENKAAGGFTCIKVKIGGIEWERELDLIRFLRERGGPQLEIRLDANGAFERADFIEKWTQLEEFNIHSIEQPLTKGKGEENLLLREDYGVPVAFDEELIDVEGKERKELLERARPRYIVLKPSLHGGFSGTAEWIALASSLGIDYWITSALESNHGLAAIAQFAAQYENPIAQGLGTGSLFKNNFDVPLKVEGEMISWTA